MRIGFLLPADNLIGGGIFITAEGFTRSLKWVPPLPFLSSSLSLNFSFLGQTSPAIVLLLTPIGVRKFVFAGLVSSTCRLVEANL